VRIDHRSTAFRASVVLAALCASVVLIAAASGELPRALRDAPAFERLGRHATFTTVFRSPVGIEGLTGDARGNLYSGQRAPAGDPCPVQRVNPRTGATAVVGFMPAPCSPSGLTFDARGRLYLTGAGAAGDEIAVLTPNAANPPRATTFATGVPGANGVAFDRRGALWTGDGGTGLGRVWRIPPQGGAATEVLRIPAMLNTAGVGREARSVPPGNAQTIVANGIAFTRDGTMLVADTARGAIWRARLDRNGNVLSRTGCDTTFPPDTLCLDAVLVAHPALEGADGIALDRAGNIWTAANERNALVVVTRRGEVQEFFRSPPSATTGLRNEGPLEFPTSPFLSGRRLCVTQSDGARRDNVPNSGGEVGPGTGFAAKIACLDQPLPVAGLPLPMR
jgi:sugar lactone lactonase YvrE